MKKYIIVLSVALLAVISIGNAQEFIFSRDLSVGTTGVDVTALQTWLITNGFDIPAISSGVASKGYFGSQTRVAVVRFQNSNGLPGTGYFGPLSRGKIGERRNTDSRAPVINGIDAPTTLNAQRIGTWTVRATDPQNGTLNYSVDWGDVAICPPGYSCTAPGIAPEVSVRQTTTFTHSFVNPGSYLVKFTVKNNLGLSTQSTITVQVSPINTPGTLSITQPNGGEDWQRGTTQTIFWTSPAYFRATYADLKLVPYQAPCTTQVCPMYALAPYTIATNISINQNSYIWNVGATVSPPCMAGYVCEPNYFSDGQYTIQICETGTNNCDSSDRPFTISSPPPPPKPQTLKVISPNGGEVWQANSTHQIIGSVFTGYINMPVDFYLDQADIYCITTPCGHTYVLDKNIIASSVYNWIVATDINNARIPAGNYRFRVCVAGSTTDCDSSDSSFTISP